MVKNYLQTQKGISIVIRGRQRVVSAGDPHYDEFVQAVLAGKNDEELLEIIEREQRRMEAAAAALAAENKITDQISIRAGQVLFNGQVVHNTLTERMLTQVDQGFTLLWMARFLANLMQNPSFRAINDLYTFLEYGQMPITEDGCFLAYRAISKDWKDIKTGTMDNSIGAIVEMPRNQVDENPDITCSKGLHACSFEYLPKYSHADGHVVVVKVNPRDVVAIPRDYNNTKMRVCRFEVVEEYENYYSERREDRLRHMTVSLSDGKPFAVLVEGHHNFAEGFDILPEALRRAADLLGEESTSYVTVRNTTTDAVLFEQENPNYVEPEEDLDDFDSEDDEDFEDDEDEDEDEEDPTFRVVTFASRADQEAGLVKRVVDEDLSLRDARSTAADALDEADTYSVQIVNELTGDVENTMT